MEVMLNFRDLEASSWLVIQEEEDNIGVLSFDWCLIDDFEMLTTLSCCSS